jgi:hypothetical protein
MTIERAIQEAMEGGFAARTHICCDDQNIVTRAEILLDPAFWQCFGKAMGWARKVVAMLDGSPHVSVVALPSGTTSSITSPKEELSGGGVRVPALNETASRWRA